MAARILIIEDDMASRELASYLLISHGCAVRTAVNGAQGLELALQELPDLVICDLQMPVMNGFEFLLGLRADPRLRAITTVAVTAFSMPGDRDKALAAGFAGYFSKPIDPATFVGAIAQFLPAPLRPRSAAP